MKPIVKFGLGWNQEYMFGRLLSDHVFNIVYFDVNCSLVRDCPVIMKMTEMCKLSLDQVLYVHLSF